MSEKLQMLAALALIAWVFYVVVGAVAGPHETPTELICRHEGIGCSR